MKLALGTVQFGLDYGVANAAGMVPQGEVSAILALARSQGIDTLDTAAAYGVSESVLGNANVDGWRIVSKLPPEIEAGVSASDWALRAVHSSLARLRQESLDAILLHRPAQLLGAGGDQVYETLRRLKADGVIAKVGISVYGPEELDSLFRHFDFDLVQAPLSILDRRLITSGWMARLADRGVEVHTRSAFLQGLLLMPEEDRPAKFDRWKSLWRAWHGWLDERGISATEACVRYATSRAEVAKVVVGVQSRGQLAQILAAAFQVPLEAPAGIDTDSEDLLNPARWPLLGA